MAAEFNLLSVPVLSPGSLREPRLTDGDSYAPPLTYNWWVRARSNGRMVRALIEEIALAYKVDMSRVWLAGYSGGAEFLSYELLSHDIDWIRGGGATFIGGGGADGVPARVRERAALNPSSHAHLLMSWHVGVLDGRSPSGRRRMATSSEGSWSARIAVQEGSAFYEGLGARTLLQVTPGRGHTGYRLRRWWVLIWRLLRVWASCSAGRSVIFVKIRMDWANFLVTHSINSSFADDLG